MSLCLSVRLSLRKQDYTRRFRTVFVKLMDYYYVKNRSKFGGASTENGIRFGFLLQYTAFCLFLLPFVLNGASILHVIIYQGSR